MRSQQIENILDVAGDRFFEFGFVNTKASDIAARSDISRASIYKTFRSKDTPSCAVLAHAFEIERSFTDQLIPIDPDTL